MGLLAKAKGNGSKGNGRGKFSLSLSLAHSLFLCVTVSLDLSLFSLLEFISCAVSYFLAWLTLLSIITLKLIHV